jgi:hypothetical protein
MALKIKLYEKELFIFCVCLLCCVISSCSKNDDGSGISATGIPDNSEAGASPYVNPAESNVNIPNVGFALEEISGHKVVNMNMTGIFNQQTGEWLDLQGTSTAGQNIWLEIDGVPRSIKTESTATESKATRAKALVDLVFLVDNSGSMSEEADLLAKEIESWSAKLVTMLDLKLGCVGYDGGYISGGMDLDTYENLSAFLNREGYSGTSRTYGFVGTNATQLRDTATTSEYFTIGECGGAALHFADEHYSFRPGANRLYVNFTDEPNQPGNGKEMFSVESVASQEDWKVWQGTIHTVFSGSDYYDEDYEWREFYEEKPWLLSDYTGGTAIIDAPSDFEGVTLDALPVTGALAHSCNVKFHFTSDLSTGLHTVKITILSPDKTVKAVREFVDVDFTK